MPNADPGTALERPAGHFPGPSCAIRLRPGPRGLAHPPRLALRPAHSPRAVLAMYAVFAVSGLACRRQADAPLPGHALYPDASAGAAPTTAAAPLARIHELQAHEPNDTPVQALRVALDVVVSGALGDQTGPKGVGDTEWIRVEPLPPTGTLWRAELLSAPRCARLDLFDRLDASPMRSAGAWRNQLPSLPSLHLPAVGVWLRLRCVGQPEVGPWRLQITAQRAGADDEREPNDQPGDAGPPVGIGQTRQGTLAPAGDEDIIRLDLGNALPGDVLLLSMTGVPDLALELDLYADDALLVGRAFSAPWPPPLLRRTGRPGEPIAIPNLDPQTLAGRPWLRVRAKAGQRADVRYALTVRPLLPEGCVAASACRDRLPVEREPNDDKRLAQTLRAPAFVTGLLDASEDVDSYALDVAAGDVLRGVLTPPPSLRARISVSDGPRLLYAVDGASPGAPIELPPRRVTGRRVGIAVSALQGATATAMYSLRLSVASEPEFVDPADGVTPVAAPGTPTALQAGGAVGR